MADHAAQPVLPSFHAVELTTPHEQLSLSGSLCPVPRDLSRTCAGSAERAGD